MLILVLNACSSVRESAGVTRKAIDELIGNGVLNLHSHIGEHEGFKTAAGWVMNNREGGVFNL